MSLNKFDLDQEMNNCEEDTQYAIQLSNDIINKRTHDLDSLMRDIQANIVEQDNPTDKIIEKYFLELTNALYFINSHCEFMGFYEDISKANAKLAYNKAYSENQIKNALNNTKVTVADNQLAADNASIKENIVNLIYARSYKIIKGKIEAAEEMVKTLSKILSSHMQEKQMSSYGVNIGYNNVKESDV